MCVGVFSLIAVAVAAVVRVCVCVPCVCVCVCVFIWEYQTNELLAWPRGDHAKLQLMALTATCAEVKQVIVPCAADCCPWGPGDCLLPLGTGRLPVDQCPSNSQHLSPRKAREVYEQRQNNQLTAQAGQSFTHSRFRSQPNLVSWRLFSCMIFWCLVSAGCQRTSTPRTIRQTRKEQRRSAKHEVHARNKTYR